MHTMFNVKHSFVDNNTSSLFPTLVHGHWYKQNITKKKMELNLPDAARNITRNTIYSRLESWLEGLVANSTSTLSIREV